MKVLGIPQVRETDGSLQIRWHVELSRALQIGTNHQARTALQTLRRPVGREPLQVEVLDPLQAEQVRACVLRHRSWSHQLPLWQTLDRQQAARDFQLDPDQHGYLPHAEQVDDELAWQLLCYAAARHSPAQEPHQVIGRQLVALADAPVMSRRAWEVVRGQLEAPDADGWRAPRPHPDGVLCDLHVSVGSRCRRLLLIPQADPPVWLVEASPAPGCSPVRPLVLAPDVDLESWLSGQLRRRRGWRRRRVRLEADGWTGLILARSDLLRPVHHGRPGLYASLNVGPLTAPGPQLAPGVYPDSENKLAELSALRRPGGALDYREQPPAAAAGQARALSAAGAMFSEPLHPGALNDRLLHPELADLETVWARRLPSGLAHPGLTPVASRLGVCLQPLALYRPLSPFAGTPETT